MSAVNTDTDTILEVLNDKLDRDANNLDTSTTNFDVVVDYQVPTAENNYTWYRKYASGWVEQGGYSYYGSSTASTTYTITLPVTMANLCYEVIFGQMHDVNGSGVWGSENYANRTTSAISLFSGSAGFQGFFWRVSGMAAA